MKEVQFRYFMLENLLNGTLFAKEDNWRQKKQLYSIIEVACIEDQSINLF